MSAESDLVTALRADGTLTAVISTRLEPAPRRLGQTAPDLTWRVIKREFDQALDRSVGGTRTEYQFDAWASTEAAAGTAGAEAVMAALKTALLAYTTSAHDLTFTGEFDVPESDDIKLAHRVLTVEILT